MSIWGRFKKAWKALTDGEGKPRVQGEDPRPALTGARPGQWASDHYEEAKQVRGWQFIAVRSLSRMASQAELTIHEVGTRAEKRRRMLKARRRARLCGARREAGYWTRRLKALAGHKRKGEPTAAGQPQTHRAVGPNHPLRKLLNRPNPEWSLATLLFAGVQQLAATGTCLLWAVRNRIGVIKELYVLPTALTQPRWPDAEYPEGSYYLHPLSYFGLSAEWARGTLGQALRTGCILDARDVKPVRWPHPLVLSDGLSALDACALWVDTANQMDTANWSLLVNSERPGMLFKFTGTEKPDPADVNRFREDLRKDFKGTLDTGKHLLVPTGLDAAPRTATATDLDFAHGAPSYRDRSLAMHGMTPIACSITEAGNYSAHYVGIKQANENGVQPILNLFGGEVTEFLGADVEGPRCEVGFAARAIDDPQLLEQRARNDIAAGNAVYVNEYRAMRRLPPIPGPEGMAFVGARPAAGATGDPQNPDGEPDDQQGDDLPTGKDTGTSRPDQKRPPGRQDANGKHLANGHRRRA